MKSFKNKKVIFTICLLLLFNIIVWIISYNLKQDYLELTYFDIGQGDSIFIETPQGHQILIDGGPSSTILEKLENEMPFYDRTIDLIVLTHPEHDHYFGLLEVLKRYEVENVLWTGVIRDTAEYTEWIDLLEKEQANIVIAQQGQRIVLQKDPLIFIDILYPFENLEGQEVKQANDTSIVAQLYFENTSFLFTGDIGKKQELEIIDQNNDLETDVLKVGHHGSNTSSSIEFIQATNPDIAIIQVGKDNSYGHPTPEVLARFKESGIDVLRTDLIGDIKIISNGNKINY
tara:strand:+ start:346 stop:1209 length:864 start_codon:yes stop_codon:yes gene_type:complete